MTQPPAQTPDPASEIYDGAAGRVSGAASAGPAPHLAEPVLRELTADGFDEFHVAADRGFQEETPPAVRDLFRAVTDPGRFFGFAVGDRWVSTFGSYPFRLTVPGGGSAAVSGVSVVTVHSAYRRRGLLRRAMRHEFALCRERGEAAAALFAAESGIYGRFGYGVASYDAELSGRTDALRFRPDVLAALDTAGGSVDEVDAATFRAVAAPLHDLLRQRRPGMVDRSAAWWAVQTSDPAEWRGGATASRFVLSYDAAGRPDGYATYRVKEGEESGNPAGQVRIGQMGTDAAVTHARLWRYLANLDLTRTFTLSRAPMDHLLQHQLADPRAVRTAINDALYLRPLDIPALLAARRYAAAMDIVIEVRDEVLPEAGGRFAVRGDRDGAEAARTARGPDMTLTARDLGAVYLGGTSLMALAAAGLVEEHRSGAVALAAAAFHWPLAPFCPDVF